MNQRLILASLCFSLVGFQPVQAAEDVQIVQTPIEIITHEAAPGDGGNSWGGHQSRIVRTAEGVFSAFTVATGDDLNREWRLVWRQAANDWLMIAQGISGREPVNLLTAPDGTLYLVGYPAGIGTLWSGQPHDGNIDLHVQLIPGMEVGYWQYSAAGMDAAGNLCLVSSEGGGVGGRFRIACLRHGTDEWRTTTHELDYRYAYAYIFPSQEGLSIIGTRDVEWGALGYQQPSGAFDYVFNALAWFYSTEVGNARFERRSFIEEQPTTAYPHVFLNAQMDAYQDTEGRMHILYWLEGASTAGLRQLRHRLVAADGRLIADQVLEQEHIGYFNRIFQDADERYFLLSSSGHLFRLGNDGLTIGEPLPLNMEGHEVEYSGFAIAAPRTGTQPGNTLDVVFPSGNESDWIYFQLQWLPPSGSRG